MFKTTLQSSIFVAILTFMLCCSIPVADAVNPSGISIQPASSVQRTMQVDVKLSNQGTQTAQDIKVQVPLISIDSPYQTTVEETFSHEVQNIQVNDNGNRMANFIIDSLAPGQSETLRIEYVLGVQPNTQNLNSDANDIDTYLQSGAKIQSDHPEIMALAQKINANADNDSEKLQNIAAYVDSHMKYNENSPAKNKGALSALQNGEGVCEDYAALYVALSRASGIPARQVNGYADPKRTGESWNKEKVVSLRGYRHSWAEVYLKDLGWVAVDPTFKIYPQAGKYTGIVSSGHIAQNYQDESVRVSYQGGKLAVAWGNLLINK